MLKHLLALALCGSAAAAMANQEAYCFAGNLTLEGIANLDGGIAQGARGLVNLDLTLAVDTQAAGWWQNGSWFIYALGDYGGNPANLTGDVQTISNIATANSAKIFEFWYKHHFADDRVQLLVGLHNYNSVFYALDSASLFSSASFGIGTDTAQAHPSIFSTTALASVLKLALDDNYYAALGFYDGIPGDPNNPRGTHIELNPGDGVFKAFEMGRQQDKSYKIGIGFWQLTARVDNPVNGLPIHVNHGHYLIGERYFSESWVGFVQYGQAASATNAVDTFVGGGIRHNGLLVAEDAIGLGFGHARNGTPFLRENPMLETAETIYEFAYSRPLQPQLNMKTSLYYIQNPGMSPELDNALALGVRLYIGF